MSNLVLNFTNTYPERYGENWGDGSADPESAGAAGFPGREDAGAFLRLDLSDIPGTDLYCDMEAQREICARLREAGCGPEGIHLLDSGNYHYMTRLFTAMLREPYALIVFDHHTDLKPAAFEGLLSCGEWVKDVLEKDGNVQRLLLIGPPESSLAEIPEELRGDARLVCVSEESLLSGGAEKAADLVRAEISSGGGASPQAAGAETGPARSASLRCPLPVYLSIDKDILRTEDALTNWDQGNVPLEVLLAAIRGILACAGDAETLRDPEALEGAADASRHTLRKQNPPRLIGADICGLLPHPEPYLAAEAERKGEWSDRKICQGLLLNP